MRLCVHMGQDEKLTRACDRCFVCVVYSINRLPFLGNWGCASTGLKSREPDLPQRFFMNGMLPCEQADGSFTTSDAYRHGLESSFNVGQS